MSILQFFIGIILIIIFFLMIAERIRIVRLLPEHKGRKLLLLVFWFIPISKRSGDHTTLIAIKRLNKLLLVLALLITLWFILAQISY